jgi:EmrB/QacA subfamily drug resistance transporter
MAKNHLLETTINKKARILLISAALLAVFLGALDALVVGAAMPSIIADLGGLPLYSWAFSAYLLARAIAMPIFGKLCDIVSGRKLYISAILIFTASSLLGGMARNMSQLIICRALQGIGAGGTFALAYIVLSDLYPPESRGKMVGMISVVWGISSILGPPAGGFIVAFASWRWIFYMNLPMGGLALIGIFLYLRETREKKMHASIDFAGAITLSVAITALLTAFLLAGREYPWVSMQIGGLLAVFAVAGVCFWIAEKKADEPILALSFFREERFSLANGSAFFSSFAIFSLSAFSPLFIQGVLGMSPAQLGMAMVPLTIGWSAGSILCGQLITEATERAFSITGSLLLAAGSALALFFATPQVPVALFSSFLSLAGLGMGFVSIPTLLIVQKSLPQSELGVATASQQFARTLGGTIGIGISGGLVTARITETLDALMHSPLSEFIPATLSVRLAGNVESVFQLEIQNSLPPLVLEPLRGSIGSSVHIVFWCALGTSLLSLALCWLLPGRATQSAHAIDRSTDS